MPQKFQIRELSGSWTHEPQNDLKFMPLINRSEFDGAISVTRVSINGKHLELITLSNVRIYILISGEIYFTIDGVKNIKLNSGAVLTIESGAQYSLEGNGEYLVINAPAFKDEDDQYI